MAQKELYDYLEIAVPDVDVTLTVNPQAILKTNVLKNQVVRKGDDGSREVLSFSNTPIPYISLRYDLLDATDVGTIFDIWMDTAKANGKLNSFKFDHPDGHTYVVSFETAMDMDQSPTSYSINTIKFYVEGRIAD